MKDSQAISIAAIAGAVALLLAMLPKKARREVIDLALSQDDEPEPVRTEPFEVEQPLHPSRKWGSSSLRNLATIHPTLARIATRALELSEYDFGLPGHDAGVRTQERQDELVARGSSKTRSSRHVRGLALDFAPWVNGEYVWEPIEYFKKVWEAFQQAAAEEGESLDWGGRYQDFGHIELIDRDPENRIIVSFDGYRRASWAEVAHLASAANEFLNAGGLEGEYLDMGDFRFALETHYNEKKGNHKGVSIFTRSEQA